MLADRRKSQVGDTSLDDARALDSPTTRIRTAFMRDGIALHTNEAPMAPNVVVLAAGRGVLGSCSPSLER